MTVLAGWIAKFLSVTLALANTRLLIELIGIDGLAVQSILMSFAAWFALLNFGIPSAVQNMISSFRAEGKDVKRIKQTASSAVCVIFFALLPLVIGIGVVIKHFVLFRYQVVATSTIILYCLGMFIAGLGALFNQLLYAEQRGYWPNLYPAFNGLCVTVGLIAFRSLTIHDINLVLLVFVFSNLAIVILGSIQSKVFYSWCLDRSILADIWRGSRGFALFSFLALTTLGVDYLIMSRILSPQDIAIYNISQRVFISLLAVYAIALTSEWSSISETLYATRLELARKRIHELLLIGGSVAVVVGGIVMMFMNDIAVFISHGQISAVPTTLTLFFVVYVLLRVWSDTFAVALLSVNQTKTINRYVPFQAAISIVAQIVLGSHYGISGILLGIIISYISTAAWVLPRNFYILTARNL